MIQRLMAVCLTALACSACGTPSALLLPRYGSLAIDGTIALAETSTSTSASNDLDDLGLSDDDSVFSGRFDFRWGSPHLTLAFSDSSHDGTGTLSSEISQGGVTIPVDTDVASDVGFSVGEAILTFDVLPTRVVDLGIGFGISVIDSDSTFTSLDTGEQVVAEETIPAPVLALRLGSTIGPVQLSGLIGGVLVDYDDVEAQILDIDLLGMVRLFHKSGAEGHFALGWRYLDTDLEYEDDGDFVDADFSLSGPYIGFAFGF